MCLCHVVGHIFVFFHIIFCERSKCMYSTYIYLSINCYGYHRVSKLWIFVLTWDIFSVLFESLCILESNFYMIILFTLKFLMQSNNHNTKVNTKWGKEMSCMHAIELIGNRRLIHFIQVLSIFNIPNTHAISIFFVQWILKYSYLHICSLIFIYASFISSEVFVEILKNCSR